MQTCQECFTPVEGEAKKCPSCGAETAWSEFAVALSGESCPHCHEGKLFAGTCWNCGKSDPAEVWVSVGCGAVLLVVAALTFRCGMASEFNWWKYILLPLTALGGLGFLYLAIDSWRQSSSFSGLVGLPELGKDAPARKKLPWDTRLEQALESNDREELVRLVSLGPWKYRKSAAEALAGLSWQPDRPDLAALYWALRGDWDRSLEQGEAAQDAIQAALKFEPAARGDIARAILAAAPSWGPRALRASLAHLPGDVQMELADAAGRSQDPRMVTLLIDLLDVESDAAARRARERIVARREMLASQIPRVATLARSKDRLLGRVLPLLAELGDPSYLPLCLEVLRNTEAKPSARAGAAEGLSRASDEGSLDLLYEMLEDKEIEVRWAAARAIRDRGGYRIPRLLQMLVAEDKMPRYYSTWLVGEGKVAEAVPRLLARFEGEGESDWEIRSETLESLGKIGSPEGIELLTRLIHDDDAPYMDAKYAAFGLQNAGIAPRDEREQIVLAVATDEFEEAAAKGAAAVVPLLSAIKGNLGILRDLESHFSFIERMSALMSILDEGKSFDISEFQQQRYETANVRLRLISMALVQIEGETDRLRSHLDTRDTWKEEAAIVLGVNNADEDVERLESALAGAESGFRSTLVRALAFTGRTSQLATLRAKASVLDQADVIWCVGEIGSAEGLGLLETAMDDLKHRYLMRRTCLKLGEPAAKMLVDWLSKTLRSFKSRSYYSEVEVNQANRELNNKTMPIAMTLLMMGRKAERALESSKSDVYAGEMIGKILDLIRDMTQEERTLPGGPLSLLVVVRSGSVPSDEAAWLRRFSVRFCAGQTAADASIHATEDRIPVAADALLQVMLRDAEALDDKKYDLKVEDFYDPDLGQGVMARAWAKAGRAASLESELPRTEAALDQVDAKQREAEQLLESGQPAAAMAKVMESVDDIAASMDALSRAAEGGAAEPGPSGAGEGEAGGVKSADLYWKCPNCGVVLEKNPLTQELYRDAMAKGSVFTGTVTCASCGRGFATGDVYSGKFDVARGPALKQVFVFRNGPRPADPKWYVEQAIQGLFLKVAPGTGIHFEVSDDLSQMYVLARAMAQGVSSAELEKATMQSFHDKEGHQGLVLKIEG